MTSHEMTLTFDGFALSAKTAADEHAFRIMLLPGELLRVPKTRRSIRVVSGAAWISHNGQDHELSPGDVLPLARTSHDALVSAEGQTLFLEIA
jgi:hypothetical protein